MKTILAAALALAAPGATAQNLPYIPPEMMPRIMADLGMELQVDALGVIGQDGGPVQFWASSNGNWYLFLIYSDGTACPHMHGTDWFDGELL